MDLNSSLKNYMAGFVLGYWSFWCILLVIIFVSKISESF